MEPKRRRTSEKLLTRREFVRDGAIAGTAWSLGILSSRRSVGAESSGVDPAAIKKFGARLKGRLILPGDPGYESARKIFNTRFDKRPAMIVRCAATDDVVRTVEFARATNLVISVRSGGHDTAGYSTCDGGLVIDLGGMNAIRVDPHARTARVGTGARVGQVYQAARAFKLAAVAGDCPSVGMGGLTLGGGDGVLLAKYGLACDNVLAAEVVTADGRVRRVDARHEQDLFWAIRGGSGNFGVVTSFECRLHPVDRVLGGALMYPLSQSREVLGSYRDFISSAPDELTTVIVFTAESLAILICYCGELQRGEQLLKPLRSNGRPTADSVKAMSFVEAATFEVGEAGSANYTDSGFLPELSEGAIEVLIEYARKATRSPGIGLDDFHGAVTRFETAFPLRRTGFNAFWTAVYKTPAEADSARAWSTGLWRDISPFTDGVWVNGVPDDAGERAKLAYGSNYDRLVAIKNRYDPTNFFHMNQNIKPTV